ncbi:MAG TPA: rod shape-determining protein MreD [Pirellulales bacterium]|nr:rod shape-determining protein MreD [Pirellulales bacterium]
MAKWLLMMTGIYVAAVLDSVVAPALEIGGASPDFLVLAVVVGSLCVHESYALTAAGLAGAMLDLCAPGRIGFGVAVCVISSVALAAVRGLVGRRPLIQSLATWIAIAVMLSVLTAVRSVLGNTSLPPASYLTASLACGLYSAVIGLPCYSILSRVDRLRAAAY